MNNIVFKTCVFNQLGSTPVGFSVNNMENAYGIFAEEVEEVRQAVSSVGSLTKSRSKSATDTSTVSTEILDGCVDTVVTAIGILYRMGMTAEQINEAFEVVADANLSKFPKTEEEAKKSVENYAQDDRYKNVQYKRQGDSYVVFGSKRDGTADYKILKGIGWGEPEDKLRKLVGDVYVERD